MRGKLKIRYIILIVLLSVVWATQLIPSLGEVYAQSVYPVISHILSSFSKLIPFAVGDLFIFLSIIGLLFNPIRARYIQKKKWKQILLNEMEYLLWIYAWFYLAWGLTERFLWQDKHSLYCLYSRNLSVICRQLYRQAECFLYRCHLH